jgi:hypothetical protein
MHGPGCRPSRLGLQPIITQVKYAGESEELEAMTTVEEIEQAVTELSPDQLARFCVWFEEFEAARFDEKIERDAKAGRLDRLADQALAEFRAGRTREL